MKIQYLSEGVFKNPEQARAAREKAAQTSNAEKVAAQTKEVIKGVVEKFIDEYLNDKDDYNDNIPYHWSDYNSGYDDESAFLQRSIAGAKYSILTACYESAEATSQIVTYKSSVDFSGSSKVIYVDIYAKIINDSWISNVRKHNEKQRFQKADRNKFDGTFNIPGHYDPYKNGFLMDEIKNTFARRLNEYIISVYCNPNTPKEFSVIRDIMTRHYIVLRKIHLFTNIVGDIVFGGPLVSVSYDEWHSVTDNTNNIKRQLGSLLDLISFENKGNVIFRDWQHRASDIVLENEQVLEENMKINYLSEGVFKNPTQARAARAAAAQQSNAEKLAGTVQKINDTQIKAEMERIISESLSKSSAFPFSSIFMQPMGSAAEGWDLSKPVDNLMVDYINDDEKTIECIIDAGTMHGRGDSLTTPVKCIVAAKDPRAKDGGNMDKSATPEEVRDALVARSINIIKNKATKQLKSRTLPSSAIFLRAALNKIVEYKFVVKKVAVGVVGALRIKNLYNEDIATDEDLKDLLFSMITFVPQTTDACIKFKNNINKEVDSGVSFTFNGIDDIAKDIVNVAIYTDVEHLIQNFKNELEMLERHDTSPNKKLKLKCKPAMKLMDKEYLAYLAKSKSITIKDVQCTYGRMAYTVINLRTKAETEEIDESKVYGKGIKITYSLAGDKENSYVYANVSKNSWYSTWYLKNKSVFLMNNLKPTQEVEEFKNIHFPSFWKDSVVKALSDAKTAADATNVTLSVYCTTKRGILLHGNALNVNYFYELDQIQKLSNGKYADITEDDLSRVSNNLSHLLELANKQSKKK